MTPEEMRAMTARMNSAHVPAYARREDLKVALTELSELQDAYREVTSALKDRAERAEAHNRNYLHTIKGLEARAERAEAELSYVRMVAAARLAALARVRALAGTWHADWQAPVVTTRELRAAIEGP